MLTWLLFVFLAILLLALLGWLYWHMDCDLQLLLADKLGRPISDLRGKVVWITGASSGIGEAIAYHLAKHGVKLVLSGTNEQRLEAVKRQCLMSGLTEDDVLTLRFEIQNTVEHQKYLDLVISRFAKLDILVNNAGRSQRALFHEIDLKVDKELFDVNVFGTINLTRIVLNYFLENKIKGHFVVTSSTAGLMGAPNSASYTASKHALHGYFECLRIETYNRNIRVTMLCPGPVFSRIIERAFTGRTGEEFGGSHPETNKRMAATRCAYLSTVAIANQLAESWIAIQPVLTLHYLNQYFPVIFKKIVPMFYSPERMNKMREG